MNPEIFTKSRHYVVRKVALAEVFRFFKFHLFVDSLKDKKEEPYRQIKNLEKNKRKQVVCSFDEETNRGSTIR